MDSKSERRFGVFHDDIEKKFATTEATELLRIAGEAADSVSDRIASMERNPSLRHVKNCCKTREEMAVLATALKHFLRQQDGINGVSSLEIVHKPKVEG